MLACGRIPAPLPAMVIGAGPDVLVVENSDTYWVAAEILGHRRNHPVGVLAWGCGKAFPSQVATLGVDVAGRGPVAGRVWYWGDLDPPGLIIAADAAATASATAGPQILPATGLWAAMANFPVQEPGSIDWSAAPGRRWLGGQLWDHLARVHRASGRVAQEAVHAELIAAWGKRGQRLTRGQRPSACPNPSRHRKPDTDTDTMPNSQPIFGIFGQVRTGCAARDSNPNPR